MEKIDMRTSMTAVRFVGILAHALLYHSDASESFFNYEKNFFESSQAKNGINEIDLCELTNKS